MQHRSRAMAGALAVPSLNILLASLSGRPKPIPVTIFHRPSYWRFNQIRCPSVIFFAETGDIPLRMRGAVSLQAWR